MDAKQSAALRKEFAPNQIGKLPKGGVMLDFVGHAIVTNRLLEVDPEWSWEPLALDAVGLPAIDAAGNLWIRLTIAGVTRLGVGDGKNMKERISDSIRNAAMRFGVALDLWAKEDLHGISAGNVPDDSGADDLAGKTETTTRMARPRPTEPPAADPPPADPDSITSSQLKKIGVLMREAGITDREQALEFVSLAVDRLITTRNDLTKHEASLVINRLEAGQAVASEPPLDDANPWGDEKP